MEVRDKNGLTEAEFLAAYRPRDHERPSLTADIAVFAVTQERTRLLLIRRGNHPFLGKWALPGGFADQRETIEETAARELQEETSLTGLSMDSVGLFSSPGRDPRMWVVSQAFVSLIPPELAQKACAGDDAAAARWFDVRTERTGGRIQITFSAGDEQFAVCAVWDDGVKLTGRPQIETAGGLAFDHAQIICMAMKTAGLL